MAGPRLQPAGPAAAPGRDGHRGRPRRPRPRTADRPRVLARRRALHGPGGAGLRFRARRGRARHQCRTGRGPSDGRSSRSTRRRSPTIGGRHGPARSWMAVQPGPARPRGHPVRGRRAPVCRLSRSASLPVGPPGEGRTRPGDGIGRREQAPSGLCRVGPPRPGPVGRGLRNRSVHPDEVAVVMGWPDHPERANRVVEQLVVDGLVARDAAGVLSLP